MVETIQKGNVEIWKIIETVSDPEIPVLTVVDMGIIRDVEKIGEKGVKITITPTYSGCPAMNMIEVEIKSVLQEAGYQKVKVTTVLSPAWTTDWLSEEISLLLKGSEILGSIRISTIRQTILKSS